MSVKKRGSTYQYDFYHNDKRYRKSGFKTKREAIAAENERFNQLNKGVDLDNDVIFSEYYKEWAEVNKSHLAQSTYKVYRVYGALLDEYFKDKKIKNITRMEYQKFINWYGIEAPGMKKGRFGHSLNTMKQLNGYIRACVQDAVFEGIISKDFTFKVTLTHTKVDEDDSTKFLELNEFKRLKERVMNSDSMIDLFYFIMMVTGGRFSDVRHMRYEHINELENEVFLPGVKNESSRRYVKISRNDMIHITSKLKKLQRNLSGDIFLIGSKGNKISIITVNKYLLEHCEDLKIKKITSHALRHTHCSILINEGVDIYYISKRLGHKNIQTTMNTYGHLLDVGHKKAEEKTLKVLASV